MSCAETQGCTDSGSGRLGKLTSVSFLRTFAFMGTSLLPKELEEPRWLDCLSLLKSREGDNSAHAHAHASSALLPLVPLGVKGTGHPHTHRGPGQCYVSI